MHDSDARIDIKKIGIHSGGYEIASPIKLNPTSTKTDNLLIMKELYGTP
jgi:hypothetical protein